MFKFIKNRIDLLQSNYPLDQIMVDTVTLAETRIMWIDKLVHFLKF